MFHTGAFFQVADGELDDHACGDERVEGDHVTGEVGEEAEVTPVGPQLGLAAVGQAGAAHDETPPVVGALRDLGLANKSFSRGVETLGAEASMVFVGNTSHTVPYMLKHSDLFDELPESYHDSAYLDRLHYYIPGWEVDTIRGEMFSDGYGFVVDYIAEVLKSMRDADYSDRYQQHFTLWLRHLHPRPRRHPQDVLRV